MVNIGIDGRTASASSIFLASNLFIANSLPFQATTRHYDTQRKVQQRTLPPFDFAGSRMVAKCAVAAQQKERRRRQELITKSTFPSTSSKHMAMPLAERMALENGPSTFLNDIPIVQTRYENPHRYGALFCRSGNWLHFPEKNNKSTDYTHTQIHGTKNAPTKFAIIEFIAIAFGLVSMKSFVSQEYLCMDGRGMLYSAPQEKYTPECVFMEEMLENYYNLYSSCVHGTKHRPWYVALRKTGHMRKGNIKNKRYFDYLGKLTRKRQKSSHFLSVHLEVEDFNKKFEIDPRIIATAKSTNNYREHVKSQINPKYFNVSKEEIQRRFTQNHYLLSNKNITKYETSEEDEEDEEIKTTKTKQFSQNTVDFWQMEINNFVSSADAVASKNQERAVDEQPYRQTSQSRFENPRMQNREIIEDTATRWKTHSEIHRHRQHNYHDTSNDIKKFTSRSPSLTTRLSLNITPRESFLSNKKRKRLEKEESQRRRRIQELERLRLEAENSNNKQDPRN